MLTALLLTLARTIEVRRLEDAVRDDRAHSALLEQKMRAARAVNTAAAKPADNESPYSPEAEGAASLPAAPGVETFRSWLEAHPEKCIPEIALVSREVWIRLGASLRPGSQAELIHGVRTLRNYGRDQFGQMASDALAAFAESHADALPASMADLAPYFPPSVTESMWNRYQVLARGSYSAAAPSSPLIGETASLDDEIDSVLNITRKELVKVTTDRSGAEIQRALHRYLSSHGGTPPYGTDALLPYLTVASAGTDLHKYEVTNALNITRKK